jgi:hypothetical protein
VEYFELSILKSFQGYRWVNTYQVVADDLTTARQAHEPIYTFEKSIHATLVTFEETRVSLSPDPTRQQFITIPLGYGGDRIIQPENLPPATVCLFVVLNSTVGRPGKKFYRFSLTDEQMMGAGDSAQLTDPNFRETVDTALQTMLDGLDEASVMLAIGNSHRVVVNAAVKGVGSVKTHHGWYNRQP